MPSQSAPNLHTLPADLLLHVIVRVAEHDLRELHALAQTCRQLHAAVGTFRSGGRNALALRLRPDSERSLRFPLGIAPYYSKAGDLALRKTSVAGDAFVVFNPPASRLSSYWEFRLDVFHGRRVEIGLATTDALRFQSVERASSWSFDCFGRASLAGVSRPYGRQMRAGDVVGVLYNVSTGMMTFLDNGVSMGELPVRSAKRRERISVPLYPFVYLPYHSGEQVTLLSSRNRLRLPVGIGAVKESARRWSRPQDLPYADRIIVHTWQEKLWYALKMDVGTTTLAALWREVQSRHGMPMHHFELIYCGKRLANTESMTLRDAGIVLDSRSGTCAADILLSVPHVVS